MILPGKHIEKTIRLPVTVLRSEPATLSDQDVKEMLIKHNFYESEWNSKGNFENIFVDNEDGTISDFKTGLMWQRDGSNDVMEHSDAIKYIDSLNKNNFAGYSDWRLPTLEELASLLENKGKGGIYIDSVFNSDQRWCWSSDTRASSGAFNVTFYYGRVYSSNLFDSNYVRAVRSFPDND